MMIKRLSFTLVDSGVILCFQLNSTRLTSLLLVWNPTSPSSSIIKAAFFVICWISLCFSCRPGRGWAEGVQSVLQEAVLGVSFLSGRRRPGAAEGEDHTAAQTESTFLCVYTAFCPLNQQQTLLKHGLMSYNHTCDVVRAYTTIINIFFIDRNVALTDFKQSVTLFALIAERRRPF